MLRFLISIVSISTVVIVVSIAFAFSARVRHPLYLVFSYMSIGWAYFAEYTYLHEILSWCSLMPNEEMRRNHKKVITDLHAKRESSRIQRKVRSMPKNKEKKALRESADQRLEVNAEGRVDMGEVNSSRKLRGRRPRVEPSSFIDEELGRRQ
jgi:hypothetical protein